MKIEIIEDLILFEINEISIKLTKNAESQHQIKQIDLQYYNIRELINEKEFTVIWIVEIKDVGR